MIEAIDLTVRRRGRTVLDAVSFDVRPGQVTGVLGGTGAGKTVLLRRMVELERGRGETLFDGNRYRSLHHPMREVGLLLDPTAGDPDRTVRGHLRLALATDRRAARESVVAGARRASESQTAVSPYVRGDEAQSVIGDADDGDVWHGDGSGSNTRNGADAASDIRGAVGAPDDGLSDRIKASRRGRPNDRIEAVLDIVGLREHSRTRLADLTEGMATRLGIAVALLGDPKTLLLDCPDRALEPEGVAWLGALLRAFTAQGRAALITGSDTETLVGMVDRVLLLDSGYLVGTRTAEEVLRAPTGASVVVRSPQIVRFAAILAEAGARNTQSEGACLEVRGLDRARVGDLAYRHGIPVHELSDRFTGSDPADLVLAACTGRRARAVVPIQGFPDGKRVVNVPVSVGTTVSAPAASGPGTVAARGAGVRTSGIRTIGIRAFGARAVDGGSKPTAVDGASKRGRKAGEQRRRAAGSRAMRSGTAGSGDVGSGYSGIESTGSVRLITVLPESAPASQAEGSAGQSAARVEAQPEAHLAMSSVAPPTAASSADGSLDTASGSSATGPDSACGHLDSPCECQDSSPGLCESSRGEEVRP